MSQVIPSYAAGALAHAPIMDILARKVRGHMLVDDFVNDTVSSDNYVLEKYITTVGTSATVTKGTTGTGTLILTSVTGEGSQVNSNEVICPAPTAGQNLYFQARVKVDVLTAAYGTCFVGLQANKGNGTSTEDAAVTGADALASNRDLVGIMVAATGAVTGRSQNGTSAGTAVAMGTATADTFMDVGFHVDANQRVRYWLNGVLSGEISGSTYVPDAAMYLELTSFGGASGGKALTIDSYAFVCGF